MKICKDLEMKKQNLSGKRSPAISEQRWLHVLRSIVNDLSPTDASEETPRPSALHKLLAIRCQSLAKELIEKGADVNVQDHLRMTPLHFSVINGYLKLSRLIIEKGTDVNAQDIRGVTLLNDSDGEGKWEITELLIRNGAGALGVVPLHEAASEGHLDLVQLLIERGADVNKKSSTGYTALHYTLFGYHGDVIKLLAQNGANLLVKDNYGYNLPYYADCTEKKSLLIELGVVLTDPGK